MKIIEYVKFIAEVIPADTLVVSSHVNNTVAWGSVKRFEGCLLGFNMGLATPVGLGLALALPHRRVLILEGDGGALLLTSAITDLASQNPANVIVVVHDNESTISIPSHTSKRADLATMAKGAGIEHTCTVRNLEEFKTDFTIALQKKALAYIVAKAEMGMAQPPQDAYRPFLQENTFRFARYIEQKEGIPVIGPGWRR